MLNFQQRNKTCKKLLVVLLFFVIAFCYFSFPFVADLNRMYDDFRRDIIKDEEQTFREKLFVEQEYANLQCKFVRLNPFDKTIIDRVYHPRTIQCNQSQPYFTFLDDDGHLHLNESEVKKYERTYGSIFCEYKTFDRADTDEDSVIGYGSSVTLELYKPVTLDLDMVEIVCKNKLGEEIYYDVHAHPAFQRLNRTFLQPTEEQLSVLMIVMDSTSISVLKRHLPKTYDFIKNVMKFKIFNGFHKIGDNSFPNMVAALTGYRYQYEQNDMPPDIDEDPSKTRFEHWPLIWKEFNKNGYATVFNEDKAEWGLFQFHFKGFKRKPVDFYYHIYWNAIHLRESKTNRVEKYCFQNQPKIVRFLDIIKRHLRTMQTVRQFHFAFLNDLCHEGDSSEEERADEYMASFFKDVFEKGYLNKTAVLFLTDHGHRYTPIRNTLVGLLEERTPMFNIWFPAWFYKKYPNIEHNLRVNTVRLSSQFDVNETLRDIAAGNYFGTQRNYLNSRGLSQLYRIPSSRTCFQAGVPDHHCTCHSMTPLNVTNTAVQTAAVTLLHHINEILSEFSDVCRRFSLKQVIRAEQLNVNEKLARGVARYNHKSTTYSSSSTENPNEFVATDQMRIAVELFPMDAQFEATMTYNMYNNSFTVHGDISRLNKYGQQSYCVQKRELRKFCICIKLIDT